MLPATQAPLASAPLEIGGNTIAVLGTPICHVYPRENAGLQQEIAHRGLVMSQVPIWRYSQQSASINRFFFALRNATIAALAEATVIVEAGDKSGTLIQARGALKQGKKVLVLGDCFERSELHWPKELQALGAVRVNNTSEILAHLQP